MKFKKIVHALLFTSLAIGAVAQAEASFVPVGVQNDVAVGTVTGWGYVEIYRGTYSEEFSLGDVLAPYGDAAQVILAGHYVESEVFDVLASASKAEVLTITDYNQTHTANGAEWYSNDSSLGFAGLGKAINQNSADTYGTSFFNAPGCTLTQSCFQPDQVDERDRLSWATSDLNEVTAGWRSGDNVNLQSATDWERVVFVNTNPPAPVPVPAAVWLLGSGVAGLVSGRRRKTAA